jgi:hypothetical protein
VPADDRQSRVDRRHGIHSRDGCEASEKEARTESSTYVCFAPERSAADAAAPPEQRE